MAGLCEGSNETSGSLKAICKKRKKGMKIRKSKNKGKGKEKATNKQSDVTERKKRKLEKKELWGGEKGREIQRGGQETDTQRGEKEEIYNKCKER
ncbi:hypothetical protein ANN_03363 [Periplaneta americana]|uniref:Uncharacterized protein n=1 Tax=Periplaneta americana TaxID=6978 RepID=A0ABQ8TYX3_PERAM|nr:hypothetical protein ANN_03363 [Periplaneta americana]